MKLFKSTSKLQNFGIAVLSEAYVVFSLVAVLSCGTFL